MRALLAVAAVALMSVSPVFAAEPAQDIDSIKFEDSMWGPGWETILDGGTKYVDKDMRFGFVFPKNSSDITQAELATLRDYEKNRRDEATVQQIKIENAGDMGILAAKHLSMGDAESDKAFADFYQMIDHEMVYFLTREKRKFQRARPTQLDPALTTVIPVPKHSAFPSGHTAQAHISARLFSYIDPVHQTDYEQYAANVGQRREIAGVHYPSDTAAGKQIADMVFDAMMKNEEFKSKVDGFKKKFEAANIH